MYLTNYGDAKQTKMSKFGSEQIRLNNLIFLCLEETTSAAGPDGRCFHAAWAVSKSVH